MKIAPRENMNHNILEPGIYLAKICDDITTYDIRMKAPNKEQVLTNSAIHTLEHIINDYLKATEFSDNIIHFGPLASRTGFVMITKSLTDKYTVELIKSAFNYVKEFWGKIPNASVNDCGNCLEHNLPQAKEEATHFVKIIESWTKDNLDYPTEPTEEATEEKEEIAID